MTKTASLILALLVLASLFAGPPGVAAAPVEFSAAGANAAAIQGTVDAFRLTLGDPNNGNAPGPLFTGRREINWDGGGTAVTPAGTPFNGFLNIRGAQFVTPGSGFVQAPPTGPVGGLDTQFSNPAYATAFQPFSLPRLFSPIGSNITDVFFFIPGTNGGVPATVSGFGAVFSDVDIADVTSIQYFDAFGASLGTFFVPEAPGTATLSFLGVVFDAGESVFRVRITTGTTALGANVNDNLAAAALVDVATLDDFLYKEPRAVPEPATALLLTVGVIAVAFGRGRRGGR